MPENILVDTKIMFLSRLDDKLWQKMGKIIIFGGFFEIFFLFWQNFQKLKKTFLIGLEWSIMAKGEVAISKNVHTAVWRYIIIHTYTYTKRISESPTQNRESAVG